MLIINNIGTDSLIGTDSWLVSVLIGTESVLIGTDSFHQIPWEAWRTDGHMYVSFYKIYQLYYSWHWKLLGHIRCCYFLEFYLIGLYNLILFRSTL
jgi:hypothetical protein